MWDVLVEHAKTCVLSGKLYVCHPDDAQNVGVVFNNIYEFSGLITEGKYISAESLSDTQKVYVDTLVKKAYENWAHVIQYDGKSLVDVKENSNIGPTHSEYSLGHQDYSSSFDHQLSLPSLSVPVPPEQPSMDSGQGGGGYGDGIGTGFPMQSQSVNLNNPIHFDPTLFPMQNPLMNSPHHPQVMRTENVPPSVGPSQSASLGLHAVGPSNLNPYRDVNEFLPEEEIRMRSHKMLENEDMQHLLRLFNMGGGGQGHSSPFSITEDGFPYSSPYMHNPSSQFSFDDGRGQSSGKAVVGWLKLKAALRWGIFIRKKAAERRA